ncbi:phosphoribosyltransferase-like protein [Aeromonas allosaccharophila]
MEKIINHLKTYANLPKEISVEEHYKKWLNQFDRSYHSSITITLSHLFEKSFISYSSLCCSFDIAINDKRITNNSPSFYWKGSYILDCQKNGGSQKVIRGIVVDKLKAYNYDFCDDINLANRLVYLDDFSFSYGRVKQDLDNIAHKYPGAAVDVIIPVMHEYDHYHFTRNIEDRYNLNVNVFYQNNKRIENRVKYVNKANVFRPHVSSLNNSEFKDVIDVYDYPNKNLRDEDYATSFFPDPVARKLAEEAFVLYGHKILSGVKDKKFFKPLGIGMYDNSLGFGASVFSYRNCPNTTPLVFWWGDYEESDTTALKWYPLMKRTGYGV